LFADRTLAPDVEAAKYCNAEQSINEVKSALDGAKYILMGKFSEDAEVLGRLGHCLIQEAIFAASVATGKESDTSQEVQKFRDYFEHDEPLKSVPSRRALAMFRGRNEGVLTITLNVGDEEAKVGHHCESMI